MQKNNISHGQIQSKNIVKVGAQFKLLDNKFLSRYNNKNKDETELQSSENVDPNIQSKVLNNKKDSRNDVQNLAIIALETMTLSSETKNSFSNKIKNFKANTYIDET